MPNLKLLLETKLKPRQEGSQKNSQKNRFNKKERTAKVNIQGPNVI